jgi:hypothetical protein
MSSLHASTSRRRMSGGRVEPASDCRLASSSAARRDRRICLRVFSDRSCPVRRLSASLRMGSMPPANSSSRSRARCQTRQRSHTPPSKGPRERRARRPRGSHRLVPMARHRTGFLVCIAPSWSSGREAAMGCNPHICMAAMPIGRAPRPLEPFGCRGDDQSYRSGGRRTTSTGIESDRVTWRLTLPSNIDRTQPRPRDPRTMRS